MQTYRVIFHIDEDTEQAANEVFNNLRNLIADLGEEHLEVELLANGRGVHIFQKSNTSNAVRIRNLARQGVKFVACANSLKHFELSPADLVDGVEVVPAGVSELVKKQAEGWAYIRP